MNAIGKLKGFDYHVEAIDKDGNIVSFETVENLIPTECATYLLQTGFGGGTPHPAWYLGLFKGNFNPAPGDKIAEIPAAATEFIDYEGSTRKQVTFGAAVSGAINNVVNRIELNVTSDAAIYGGFLASSSGKGATTGVLGSIVRFASPKQPGAGGLLRVTVSNALLS